MYPNDPPPLLACEHASGLNVLGHSRREDMGEEHGKYRPDNDPDNVNQSQVLPTVVDDEHTHHGDGGVDDPINKDWFMQSLQSPVGLGRCAQIGSISLGCQDLSKNEGIGL